MESDNDTGGVGDSDGPDRSEADGGSEVSESVGEAMDAAEAEQETREAIGEAGDVLSDVAEQVDPGDGPATPDPEAAEAEAFEGPPAAGAGNVDPEDDPEAVDPEAEALEAVEVSPELQAAAQQAADALLAENFVAQTDGPGAGALDVEGIAEGLLEMDLTDPELAAQTYGTLTERLGPALTEQLNTALQPPLEAYPVGRQFHADEIAMIEGAAPGFRDYLAGRGVEVSVAEAERILAQSAFRMVNPSGADVGPLPPEQMEMFDATVNVLGWEFGATAEQNLHRNATDYLRGVLQVEGVGTPLDADPLHPDAGGMFHFMPPPDQGTATGVYADTLDTHTEFYVENEIFRDIPGATERLAEHERIKDFIERGTWAAAGIATGVVAVGAAPTLYTAALSNPVTVTEGTILGAEIFAGEALGGASLAPYVAPATVAGVRLLDELGEMVPAARPGLTELDALRARLNVPETNTVGVGRTDVPGLEMLMFEGASTGVLREAELPPAPLGPIAAPFENPLFTRHAEEVMANQFVRAVEEAGLTPADMAGRTLDLHVSTAVCTMCRSGLTGTGAPPGVLKQLSDTYPELTIRVTSEGPQGTLVVRNGALVDE